MNLTKLNLVLALIFSFTFAFAQSSVGLKIGGHLASWHNNFDRDFGFRNPQTILDFQFGAFFEIKLTDHISIQPEILYLKKGVLFTRGTEDSLEWSTEYTFKFYELPLLLKLKFGDPNNISFFLNAGPSLGYGIKGEFEYRFFDDNPETFIEEYKFKKNTVFNRFDFSAAFGAGVGLPFGFGRLILETRYLLGLSNFFTKEYFNSPGNSIKNTGLGVSVGYSVPLSRKKKIE